MKNKTNRNLAILTGALLMTSINAGMANAKPTLKLPEIKSVQFQPPQGEKMTLKNGITVYYMQDNTLPVVHLQAIVKTGKIYDPAKLAGLGTITLDLMHEGGTAKYPSAKMDKTLENLGASISATLSLEEATFDMTSLKKDFSAVLDIFADVLRNPAFEADKVKLVKSEYIAITDRRNDEPGRSVSSEALRRFFGPNHPYGQRMEKATINAITVADMKKWHKNYVQPGNMMLAVAGDFGSSENLANELEKAFGSWQAGKTEFPKIEQPKSIAKRKVFHIQKPSSQTYIAMVQTAPKRLSQDEYALSVANEILGGGLSSRLAAEVRSRRGLAYTVYSYAGKRSLEGFEMAYCGTKPSTAAEAIEVMLGEFRKIQEEPVPTEELERAKSSIVNSFVFRFPTPFSLITNRMGYDYYNYPKDYLENYVQNIEKIDAAAVQDAAKRLFRPDDMIIFVIGDASKFDKPLSTFGEVVELTEAD